MSADSIEWPDVHDYSERSKWNGDVEIESLFRRNEYVSCFRNESGFATAEPAYECIGRGVVYRNAVAPSNEDLGFRTNSDCQARG